MTAGSDATTKNEGTGITPRKDQLGSNLSAASSARCMRLSRNSSEYTRKASAMRCRSARSAPATRRGREHRRDLFV